MPFIRTILFNLSFYVGSLLVCIILIPTLFCSRKIVHKGITFYFAFVSFLERHILNLHYKVEGLENLPKDGSYLIALKHQSAYETLKLVLIFKDPAIIYKKELNWLPLWGLYLIRSKMIAVNRSNAREAMRNLLKSSQHVIDDKRPIAIFPQGTRTSLGEKKAYKSGFMHLYRHYNIPIVPVALNSGYFWSKNNFLKKSGTVTFKILPAIPPGQDMKETLKQLEIDIERETDLLVKQAQS